MTFVLHLNLTPNPINLPQSLPAGFAGRQLRAKIEERERQQVEYEQARVRDTHEYLL